MLIIQPWFMIKGGALEMQGICGVVGGSGAAGGFLLVQASHYSSQHTLWPLNIHYLEFIH